MSESINDRSYLGSRDATLTNSVFSKKLVVSIALLLNKGRRGLIRSYYFGTVLINNVIQFYFVATVFWKSATSVQFDDYDFYNAGLC